MSAIELSTIMFFVNLKKERFLEDNIHLNFRVSVFVSFVVCLFLFSFHFFFLTAIPLGQTRKISIITKDTGKPDLPCKVTVISPKGQASELPTAQSPDGYETNFTPKEPGQYTVKVECADKEVPKSPFTVTVETTETKAPKPGKPMEQQRKHLHIFHL